jgi:hypothetical protein
VTGVTGAMGATGAIGATGSRGATGLTGGIGSRYSLLVFQLVYQMKKKHF